MRDEDQAMNDTTTDTSQAPQPGQVAAHTHGIADVVLDLDEALSGEIRRAERTARFCIEPHLQADLDRLDAEMMDLVDDRGNPLDKPADSGLAGDDRDITIVTGEYKAAHEAYIAAMRSVRVRAMPTSAWEAFKDTWRKDIEQQTFPTKMKRQIVAACAFKPAITAIQYDELVDRYGEAAMAGVAQAAWAACDHTGVDVPKSLIYSAIRRQLER